MSPGPWRSMVDINTRPVDSTLPSTSVVLRVESTLVDINALTVDINASVLMSTSYHHPDELDWGLTASWALQQLPAVPSSGRACTRVAPGWAHVCVCAHTNIAAMPTQQQHDVRVWRGRQSHHAVPLVTSWDHLLTTWCTHSQLLGSIHAPLARLYCQDTQSVCNPSWTGQQTECVADPTTAAHVFGACDIGHLHSLCAKPTAGSTAHSGKGTHVTGGPMGWVCPESPVCPENTTQQKVGGGGRWSNKHPTQSPAAAQLPTYLPTQDTTQQQVGRVGGLGFGRNKNTTRGNRHGRGSTTGHG